MSAKNFGKDIQRMKKGFYFYEREWNALKSVPTEKRLEVIEALIECSLDYYKIYTYPYPINSFVLACLGMEEVAWDALDVLDE